MAWEREHHHINLDASEHVISLIERGVVNRKGEPSRYLIQIKMGGEKFESIVGPKSITIHVGHGMEVEADGTLRAFDGSVFDPRVFEKQMIEKLNQHHANMRAYARKHSAPEYKGAKK